MTVEEKLKNIIGDKGVVTYNGKLCDSNDDLYTHWYELFHIKFEETPYKNSNAHWGKIIKHNFSKRKVEFWVLGSHGTVHIENSLYRERKKKLKRLQS